MYEKADDFPSGAPFITTWYLELLEEIKLVTTPLPCIRFKEYGSIWRTLLGDVRELRVWLNVLSKEWRCCALVKVNRYLPLQGKGFMFFEDGNRN